MNGQEPGDLRQRVYKFFTSRVVYHSLFWIMLFLFLYVVSNRAGGFLFNLGVGFTDVSFYAILVYFNLNYLIPNYLTNQKIFTYLILLVLSAIIITPIKLVVLYFIFSGMEEAQASLLSNRYFYFVSSLIILGGSTIMKIISDWSRNLREKRELETRTMQSELRFLKSQINPHFLFNTLNNLYALTLKQSEKAPEIVIKLSEMMRYMLYECNEKRVPLRKEVNYIQNYLDLEALRQGKNVDITFEVEGELRDQMIAPLMFTPFLENSFKHGLNNNISSGFVNIQMNITDHKVHFFIENSKSDAPPTLPGGNTGRSGGIGLTNLNRRLNLLYPDKYSLRIDDKPGAYAVNLELDLEENTTAV